MTISCMLRTLLLTASMGVTSAYAQLPASVITQPTFLLLGEVHDNPVGHQLRLDDLRTRIDAGWRPVIAMEQFDRERNEDLQHAMQTCADAQCVVDKAGEQRWEWPLYIPVIALAMQYKLQIVAANVSRQDAALILRQGFAAGLSDDDIRTFGLPDAISSALRLGQEQAIVNGHCGYQPEATLLTGFVNAQIVRDLWMAKTMMAHQASGVVLLAGNGHVRHDLGAVYWLKYKHMTNIQSVGYLESDSHDAENTDNTFDVVKKIAPHVRPDPCATLTMPAK